MLYLFTGVSQLPDDFIDTCKWFLPKWRLDRMMSYRYSSDRKLSASAYLILVYALKNEGLFHALPEFGYGPNGKPFLINNPGLHFNFSHCSNAVVCFLSDTEVGVDVERVCEYDDELAQAICNDDEYRMIVSTSGLEERALRFTELWTRKESVVKWRGTGIDRDPKEILMGHSAENQKEGLQIFSVYYPAENIYISVCNKNV